MSVNLTTCYLSRKFMLLELKFFLWHYQACLWGFLQSLTFNKQLHRINYSVCTNFRLKNKIKKTSWCRGIEYVWKWLFFPFHLLSPKMMWSVSFWVINYKKKMWYDCQWDNSPQEIKMTQKLTTIIGHCTACFFTLFACYSYYHVYIVYIHIGFHFTILAFRF